MTTGAASNPTNNGLDSRQLTLQIETRDTIWEHNRRKDPYDQPINLLRIVVVDFLDPLRD